MTVQEFAEKIFSDVREMSKSALGVTRLGYTEKETEVLRYLESTARNLGPHRSSVFESTPPDTA